MIDTVKKLIDMLHDGGDAALLFGNFLDDFYRAASTDQKAAMIADEPELYSNVERLYYVQAAATAHKLANDYQLPVPRWTFKPLYYLDYMYFPVSNGKLRAVYAFESPPEFKHRNLFVPANTLSRA